MTLPAKQSKLTDAEIDALRQQNGGRVAAIDTLFGTAVFRPATAEEFAQSWKNVTGGRERSPRWLVIRTVVSPTPDVLETWIKARPGIPKAADGPICRLVGMNIDAIYDVEDERVVVETAAGNLAFKCPDELQMKRYQTMLDDGQLEAAENLFLSCALDPPREALKSALASYPGLAITCRAAILSLAGADENERGKEY